MKIGNRKFLDSREDREREGNVKSGEGLTTQEFNWELRDERKDAERKEPLRV